jgi:hypothetical protein
MTGTTPPPLETRDQLRDYALTMLDAAMAHGSAGHARIYFDGTEGGYGHDVDGLEGFARTFLMVGYLLKGSDGAEGLEAAQWYAQGLAAGVDPSSAERWVRLDEHPQAKVEAASLALVLDMTRPWIWDKLSDTTKQHVIDYFSPVVGDQTYPQNNWVWFRLVVQTFLKSVGGPFSLRDMEDDLATYDSFIRAEGWLSDGKHRAFDHYVGWALHLYPTLWSRMAGASALADSRSAGDRERLDRYLTDALALVGADGSPLIQGRSLTYRYAAAAPFWIGAIAGVPSHRPGALRHAALSIVNHFAAHGAPDANGVLTIGWHKPWPAVAQSYSGPGSPYWATKGLLGLVLPADHPVWSDPAVPLPVERGDVLIKADAPGWIVSGTRADGIVRVINHGTDHALEGDRRADSPLYARLGYSTATSPLLDEASWVQPLSQSVCLADAAGHGTHRTGLRTLELRVDGDHDDAVGVAASVSRVHWVEPVGVQVRHGAGFRGEAVDAGTLTVVSLVRGPYEVRLARVTDLTDAGRERAVGLRLGGWPVADDAPVDAASDASGLPIASARSKTLVSRIYAATTPAEASTTTVADASPLGHTAVVPWLLVPLHEQEWVSVMVELSGTGPGVAGPPPASANAVFDVQVQSSKVSVTWPDGVRTETLLETDFPSPNSVGTGSDAVQPFGSPKQEEKQ